MNSASNRWVAVAMILGSSSGTAFAQRTVRLSVTSTGAQVGGPSSHPVISADGRHVGFEAGTFQLVRGDTNDVYDVFVRDLGAPSIERVSVNSAGEQGNSDSNEVALNANGRILAFTSFATNLDANDANGTFDVFVRDRGTGVTKLESASSAGQPGNYASYGPSLSDDGRYLAFWSFATNLVPGDSNNDSDVFVRDRLAGTTTRVSVSSLGVQGNLFSNSPRLSADGRFVAFRSFANNLVPADTNNVVDLFVHELATGVTTRENLSTAGNQANRDVGLGFLSSDGRYVAFSTDASTLDPLDLDGNSDAFVRDRVTGQTAMVSLTSTGATSPATAGVQGISADGRYVDFTSDGVFVAEDGNARVDVFRRDRTLGQTIRVNLDSCGNQTRQFTVPIYSSMSADGSRFAFDSTASNLVEGDTNNKSDVFFVDVNVPFGGPACSYCASGVTSNGCVPTISGAGAPSASLGSGFTVSASQLEGAKTAIFFYGFTVTQQKPAPGSSSYLCTQAIARLPVASTGGTAGQCDGSLSFDWNATFASPAFANRDVSVQAWFRDPGAPNASNLTAALQFRVQP